MHGQKTSKFLMHVSAIRFLHDHPFYLCCPDVLSLVGDPLSGNGCGSPNQIWFLLLLFTCCFIYSIYS